MEGRQISVRAKIGQRSLRACKHIDIFPNKVVWTLGEGFCPDIFKLRFCIEKRSYENKSQPVKPENSNKF